MTFLDPESLYQCTWYEFERAVYRMLAHVGWKGLSFTSKSNDKGADIIGRPSGSSEFIVLQCKHTGASSIGVQGVNDLLRACDFFGLSKGILVSNSGLSRVAKARIQELSGQYSLAFWGITELVKISHKLPKYSTQRKEPRPYQQTAINKCLNAFGEGQERGLVVFATGLGKSIVLAEMCVEFSENRGQNVLLMADRVPLIEQLEESIWPQVSLETQTRIWDGHRKPRDLSGITVATQQSVLAALRRGDSFPRFGIVMIDECHHAASPTYLETLENLSFEHLLGVTATPWRGDERRISDVFGKPIETMGIVEGIQKGFLADVNYMMFLDNIDWEVVGANTQSALSIKDLNLKLFLPARDDELCSKVIEGWNQAGRPPVITFCRTIDHATRLADLFTVMGLPSRAVHSRDMSQIERAKHLMQFKSGEFSNLIGVDILNEGVDVPDVGMVVFARVTHSRRIFVQQLGRGLRVTPEKNKVIVYDFVADIRRIAEGHKLNRESRASGRSNEVYRGAGANLVHFNQELKGLFVEEFLADIADLEESDKVRMNFIE